MEHGAAATGKDSRCSACQQFLHLAAPAEVSPAERYLSARRRRRLSQVEPNVPLIHGAATEPTYRLGDFLHLLLELLKFPLIQDFQSLSLPFAFSLGRMVRLVRRLKDL